MRATLRRRAGSQNFDVERLSWESTGFFVGPVTK
jgi:hypothetical protein